MENYTIDEEQMGESEPNPYDGTVRSVIWKNIPQPTEPFPGNTIHHTAIIYPGVSMGTGNYIGPFCIIGAPAEHKAFWGKEGLSNLTVVIGSNNIITGHVTIDAGMDGVTTISNNCFLMKHSHVGHDALLWHEVTLSPGAVIGGHCEVKNKVTIGINAAIHQWVKIPDCIMLGMGCVVTKKTVLKPYRKYAGVPAKDIGENVVK